MSPRNVKLFDRQGFASVGENIQASHRFDEGLRFLVHVLAFFNHRKLVPPTPDSLPP
jgi:hypothetical protein